MLNFQKISGHKYLIVAVIFVLLTGCLFLFETQILNFYWGLKCPSPVVWKDVKIYSEDGMVYKLDDNKIFFTYWKGHNKANLSISRLQVGNPSRLLDVLSKQGNMILENHYYFLKGLDSYWIKYTKKGEKNIKIAIYILPLSLLLHYEGPEEEYYNFKNMIEKIEFMDSNSSYGNSKKLSKTFGRK